ncbi:hypothetical protein BH10BAC3_BH10BAC3_36040 [soil metagenome]
MLPALIFNSLFSIMYFLHISNPLLNVMLLVLVYSSDF